ncbi:hypothetical protein M3A49_42040 [Paraburkholderia sp. CNPSo 3076]|uniref:hypothetical protein n=1 Tax=Paraburkholderia sp. CNPSo 3076 TaxID=2940936 RepID=UPI002251BF48|nr:hypothetical protein [Paraburkholderia sp. CNPSo 3076]MCX5545870.1 hypothetical protein [Paraburkholderia sp. CNPSo 3076]
MNQLAAEFPAAADAPAASTSWSNGTLLKAFGLAERERYSAFTRKLESDFETR